MTKEDLLDLKGGSLATIKGKKYRIMTKPEEVGQYHPVDELQGCVRVMIRPADGGLAGVRYLKAPKGNKHLEILDYRG